MPLAVLWKEKLTATQRSLRLVCAHSPLHTRRRYVNTCVFTCVCPPQLPEHRTCAHWVEMASVRPRTGPGHGSSPYCCQKRVSLETKPGLCPPSGCPRGPLPELTSIHQDTRGHSRPARQTGPRSWAETRHGRDLIQFTAKPVNEKKCRRNFLLPLPPFLPLFPLFTQTATSSEQESHTLGL